MESLSLACLDEFSSQKVKVLSMSCSCHSCSFLPFPEDALCLTPILLPSLPRRGGGGWGQGFPTFCFTTATKMVTRLIITRLTPDFGCRSTSTLLLFAFQKSAEKGPFGWFFLIQADTSEMVSIVAFIAAYPLRSINTIDVHNAITNMLQFKPNLVLCLNGTNEAFPAIHLCTLSMIICIQLHSKEENSRRVGCRSRSSG